MKNIDAKLIELYNEINRREKLKIHLIHLDEMIHLKGQEKEYLAVVLAKEENDVVTLESLSIHSLFTKILGTQERQLEKERQEYLHALMMYRGVEETYISLIEERNVLIKSLNGLHVVEREFDRLIEEKDDLLKKADSYPKDLNTLNERIASFNIQITEIDLAINKGVVSKRYLHRIIFNLDQIRQWGFQGRVPSSSSMIRKKKVIHKEIYTANKFLQKYEDQLHNISVHFSINFDKQIKNLEAFLDRFVDDLITDWVVKNKIENSGHLVSSMMDTITKLNGSLEFHKSKVKKYLEDDEDQKGHLILEYIKKTT